MKHLIVLLAIMYLAVFGFAQSSRTTLNLDELVWKYSSFKTSNELSKTYNDLKTLDFSSASTFDTTTVFIAKVNTDIQMPNMVALYCFGSGFMPKVVMNGATIKNEIADGNLYADVTPHFIEGTNFLEFRFEVPITGAKFKKFMKNSQLNFATGLVFTLVELKNDSFLGGKLISTKVKNFNNVNIDGKILARLLNGETFELITETNNCAYVRGGKEITVELSFPELGSKLVGKSALVELKIVDKEKDEEEIDSIMLLINF